LKSISGESEESLQPSGRHDFAHAAGCEGMKLWCCTSGRSRGSREMSIHISPHLAVQQIGTQDKNMGEAPEPSAE